MSNKSFSFTVAVTQSDESLQRIVCPAESTDNIRFYLLIIIFRRREVVKSRERKSKLSQRAIFDINSIMSFYLIKEETKKIWQLQNKTKEK
jgi:hypothetical protein